MRSALRPLTVIAMVALTSAGCGSNGPSETGTASSGMGKASSARERGMKFADCVRDHGDLQPPGFIGQKRSASKQESALAFAQCMRDEGVTDFPDPTPNSPLIDTNRIPSAAGRGARSIPGFTAATDKCGAKYSRELGLK
jgi:hypothetical protein